MREVPQVHFPHEGLTPLNGQPAYDTSYVSHRQVAKDCLFSYRGNRYSVPHLHAGTTVTVREPLDSYASGLVQNRQCAHRHPVDFHESCSRTEIHPKVVSLNPTPQVTEAQVDNMLKALYQNKAFAITHPDSFAKSNTLDFVRQSYKTTRNDTTKAILIACETMNCVAESDKRIGAVPKVGKDMVDKKIQCRAGRFAKSSGGL